MSRSSGKYFGFNGHFRGEIEHVNDHVVEYVEVHVDDDAKDKG